MSIKQTMYLSTVTWHGTNEKEYESFQLTPVSLDCPYLEGFYDPLVGVLVLFSKEKKEEFTDIEKVDQYGDKIFSNNRVLKDRHLVKNNSEHYIDRPDEIKDFLQLIAVNADTYDYGKYLKEIHPIPKTRKLYPVRNNLATASQ